MYLIENRKKNKIIIYIFICLLSLYVSLIYSENKTYAACDINVTNSSDSGLGSLRQAIQTSNSTPGIQGICFSVGSGAISINPLTPLPAINASVVIDGTTQPGYTDKPIVEISGNNIPNTPGANMGLRITGSNVGSTEIRGLIINGFREQGIFIDAGGVKIAGNYIGIGSDGLTNKGNGTDGIGVYSAVSYVPANNNIIGGSTVADRNIISGNGGNGIAITAQSGIGSGIASNNIISGNYIGVNFNGTAKIANNGDGILVNSVSATGTAAANRIGGTVGTTIDGPCTGECNLISGNGANGIGTWYKGTSDTVINGNYVGTDVNGQSAIANNNIGIELNESPNNTVGSGTPQGRNILSGNGGAGLFITGIDSKQNAVKGNYIGTNSSGTAKIANNKMGVSIGPTNGPPSADGSANNTIGGTNNTNPDNGCFGDCNLISGNGENGILIASSQSSANIILSNYIGLNFNGAGVIPNNLDGIGVLNTPNLLIGNGMSNGRNTISGNLNNGIIIVGGASTGNRIAGNTIGNNNKGNQKSGIAISGALDTAILNNNIYSNGLLGIDLDNNGSPNLNDANDLDNGANRLQNTPNIYSAKTSGSTTRIGGNFNGAPITEFTLDFFTSDSCNAGVPNNYGEGQNYVGSTNINTDIFGNTAFGYTPPQMIFGGKYVTATATKKINGIPAETSEFSQCILVNVSKIALTNGATWFLKNDITTGQADKTFGYGFPSSYLLCAWDPNQPGVKLPVIFSNSSWFMRASYTTGTADLTMQYGFPGSKPICGDWDGDGVDTVGAVTNDNLFNMRNSNNSGPADAANNVSYGYIPGYPVVGDWDGDGVDTIGSVNVGGTWSLRNTNSPGPSQINIQFGFPGAVPVVW